ncbi:NAD(P)/FAD-dependent oxidoreductase [Streptomyces lanatus]|uniref:FAD-dependent oxidoreductase n=1 Tax=Streptomyces lanatus TaxID=66900 RepID=A0ABV1XLT4_9ACTN|nr:FAD-dependent oxidoreductase [Streptomyces lanatus]GHG99102.1 hypothetical protein GCM10018780_25540 [Streptomyces lanatus]
MGGKRIVAIGGSDAGISAALRARELDPDSEVTVVVADAYPKFSICGIPYHVSGEVGHWSDLAHRTLAELKATGILVHTDTLATGIDVTGKQLTLRDAEGRTDQLPYDALIVGTGAVSARPPIAGLSGSDALGPQDGVHLLHSMGDTFAFMQSLAERRPKSVVVIGAGYIGLEMAEALTTRGLKVTQIEALPEVLPTVDVELGALVHDELAAHGVEVITGTQVSAITRAPAGDLLHVHAAGPGGAAFTRGTELVLVIVGVRLGAKGAIDVDEYMRTSLPDVYAAGDCAVTHHRLLGKTWLPSRPPLTSRAASRARMHLAVPVGSPAASAPRSSRSSIWSPPAPACATPRRNPREEAGLRPPPPAVPWSALTPASAEPSLKGLDSTAYL